MSDKFSAHYYSNWDKIFATTRPQKFPNVTVGCEYYSNLGVKIFATTRPQKFSKWV